MKISCLECQRQRSTLVEMLETRDSRRQATGDARRQDPLKDRIIIITGASSGIGEATALKLSSLGANVAVLARRKEKLEDLASRIDKAGSGKALAVCADVTSVESMRMAVAQACEYFKGSVWGLVNCAGVMHYQKVSDLDVESWNQQLDTNCRGVLNSTAAVLPSMKEAGKQGLCVYSATKHFVEAWAQELVAFGIKVTNVQPGDVKTELLMHTRDPSALAEFGGDSNRQMLESGDVAEMIAFAMTQKTHCAVNEILVEPTEAPL
ncbi:hypothetical protein GUITHDRAFT_110683 [Guillardia theta CCMP2712]|uniref:Ketoreductase domain-containing protein n=1 Tax=Guillardia theta (strain CCMP2712) TaxID=905079 RepID=L1J433_GUITC|nr:hypothetical protein GUITHDRAFT_110683 [Guillardia theta CCMP2712]EKX43268.1 hypothetical protein GUITHDRAFT_110683 [Guillardia theta CCMP2712]|eukprot:XP_005830248.1 hypothetical protein GUITHDRAFT_110683 [Guillardia theta CCMP2712]